MKIEKSIPIPSSYHKHRELREAMALMVPGDSILLENHDQFLAAYHISSMKKIHITGRKLAQGGWRIWRVKKK